MLAKRSSLDIQKKQQEAIIVSAQEAPDSLQGNVGECFEITCELPCDTAGGPGPNCDYS